MTSSSSSHPILNQFNPSFLYHFSRSLDYCAEFKRILTALYGGSHGKYIQDIAIDQSLQISLPQLSPHKIRFCSSSNKKTAKQHAYWSAITYLHTIFKNWRDYFKEVNLSTQILCTYCSHDLGNVKDYCFYLKSEKDIMFSLHPSCNRDYETNHKLIFVQSEIRKAAILRDILCPLCRTKIGTETSLGPRNSRILFFGHDSINFANLGSYFCKWRILYHLPEFILISRFDPDSETKLTPIDTEISFPPLVFPSREEDFGWVDLVVSPIHPRSEQLKAYHLTLLRNSIIVLPTGAGKTLIAALTIARFVKLNPNLLSVMLVDRVPLVFQHASSILRDIRLRVCQLCSETSNPHLKRKIIQGSYECVIATAGSFVELLKHPAMSIRQLSVIVFDECHHTSGNHVYGEVLRQVESSGHRPRLLGLSASPVSGKNSSQIQSELTNLKSLFLQAVVFKPPSVRMESVPTWHLVDLTKEQIQRSAQLQVQLLKICKKIKISSNDSRADEWFLGKSVTAIQSWAQNIFPPPSNADLQSLRDLARAFELNKLLGPRYSHLEIQNYHSVNPHDLSPFLEKLEEIIRGLPLTSRTLIFVEQKDSAKKLQVRLKSSFPNLNPVYICGNTGSDGMMWKYQSEILRNFNRDESLAPHDQIRLIISTSVLEEGLDIQGCDAVIRFGGQSSFIRFVQSRGRARCGTMHVILTREDQLYIDRVQKEEHLLHLALRVESTQANQILDDSLGGFQIEYSTVETFEVLSGEVYDAQHVPLKFFANCPDAVSNYPQKLLTSDIVQELLSLGFVTGVKNLLVEYRQALTESGNLHLFEGTDSIIHLNVITDFSCADFFMHLLTMWQFSIPYASNRKVFDIYLPLPSNLSLESPVENRVNGITRVEVGFLTARRSYEVTHRLGVNRMINYRTLMISESKVLKLEADLLGCVLTLQFPFLSLHRFALISADQQNFTIFIFLTSPPVLLLTKEKHTVRISCPHDLDPQPASSRAVEIAQSELRKIAETSLFAITFPLTKCAEVLGLMTSKCKGLNIYCTHLIIEGSVGTEMLRRENEFSELCSRVSSQEMQLGQRVLFSLSPLSSLIHSLILNPISLHEIRIDILQTLLLGNDLDLDLDQLSQLLDHFPSLIEKKSMWTDYYKIYIELKGDLCLFSSKPSLHFSGYQSVHRIFITPSRVLFRPTHLIKSSRLLRKFQSESFAYVSFVDEDTNPIYNTDIFSSRFLSFLTHGIPVGCTLFSFLLSSASQQREQRAIFIQGNFALAQSLRDSIASYSQFNGDIAKYMSRLGLFCTADTFVTSEISSIKIEPNIYTLDNSNCDSGKNLVDGSGKVSQSLLNLVKEKFPTKKSFCAFLFRCGGAKGVLYQFDDMDKCDIIYSESNVKFNCDDPNLCVVQPAVYNPVTLNREVLNLLFSFPRLEEWNPFPYVRNLQRKELTSIGEIFLLRAQALSVLTARLHNEDLTDLSRCSFDLFEDLFVKQLLSVIYHHRCRMLRTKSHIPLEMGAYLMGIPDPTGLLKDGQIFYQICDSSRPHMIGSGRNLIYRNPCLDPGDIRVVTAVDIPALRTYFNVLVLPASSSCRRSLSAECSGGDLDGDMFSIIFDEELIPPMECPAVDYDLIAKEAKQMSLSPQTHHHNESGDFNSQISEYIIHVMTNSKLGKIARLHLALCDQLPDQAFDPLAQELARMQSLAVDFVKTGLSLQIPFEAELIVKSNGYPTFMENKTKPSYPSHKPLGILYDDVTSGICDFGSNQKHKSLFFDGVAQPNPLFLVLGREIFEEEANQVYSEYCSLIEGILSQFSLKYDSELVLSLPLSLPPDLMRDQGAVEQSLSDLWAFIKLKYRAIFRQNLAVGESDFLKKASAWHHVAYSTPPYFLSFSWIISDYLVSIAKENSIPSDLPDHNKSYNIIGVSVLKYWSEIREELYESVNTKINFFHQIQNLVGSSGCGSYDLMLYGSVELFLCDEESDLDIYVGTPHSTETSSKLEQLSLLDAFLPVIENSCSVKLMESSPVPVIEGHFDNEDQSVDFSACIDGVYKARYIHYFYSQSSNNIIIMNCLMNWARCCQLIPISKDLGDRLNLIRKGEFHALVLSILDRPNICSPFSPDVSQISPTQILTQNELSPEEIGLRLILFFRTGLEMSNDIDFQYTWPVPGSPTHIIKAELMKRVTLACSRAYHCLLISRDWATLQTNALAQDYVETATIRRIPLRWTLAKHLLTDSAWHIMKLQDASKASVKITATNTQCVIEGTGTRSQILSLRGVFRKTYLKSRKYLGGALLVSNSTPYFMPKATLFYCRQAYSVMSRISFETYSGPKQEKHRPCRLSRPISHLTNPTTSWESDYKVLVRERFLQQLESVYLQPQENLTVSIQFGTFYAINAEDCFKTSDVTLNDLTVAFARGRTGRKEFKDSLCGPDFFSLLFSNSNSNSFSSELKEPSAKRREVRNLSASFWNSIANWRNSNVTFESLQSPLDHILLGLGYTLRESKQTDCQDVTWLVSCLLSRSYATSIKYVNDTNSPVSVAERPLVWINAMLLSGQSLIQDPESRSRMPSQILSTHDLRLKVCTMRKLEEDDHMYQSLFPPEAGDNPNPKGSKALFAVNQKGEPVPRDTKVTYIRKIISRVIYTFESPLTACSQDHLRVEAMLSTGDHFFGEDLNGKRTALTLSLHVDPKPLVLWMNNKRSNEEMSVWLDAVMDHMFVVSDAIKNEQQGSERTL